MTVMLNEPGRRMEPPARNRRGFAWNTGRFDTARRDLTREVEGSITLPHDLVLVTLTGSARHIEVTTDCGHRYSGADSAGTVSFLPAGCNRRMKMSNVEITWATLSLRPDLLAQAMQNSDDDRTVELPSFTNLRDPFMLSLVSELATLPSEEAGGAGEYCEAMAMALAQHLVRRHGTGRLAARNQPLPAWQLRRVLDYIEAHLDRPIQVAELARLADLSPGHFHRALRATTGQTPLDLINRRRIERARQLLVGSHASMAELCLDVGFSSPSHFARLFRRATGVSPSEYRDGLKRNA